MKFRRWETLFWSSCLVVFILPFLLPPVQELAGYHNFIDTRTLLGVPNSLNVLSNLPFLVVGAMGMAAWRFSWSYRVFFLAVFLTGIGSIYYHWAPTPERLFWDRLPMALAFSSLFVGLIGDRVNSKLERWLLAPLLVWSVFTVLYWRSGQIVGEGDLRFYVAVQFGPMILIPLMLLTFPARYTRTADFGWMILAYAVAKLFEVGDALIYRASGSLISGHSLKHLAAALATAMVLVHVTRRERVRSKG